MEVFLKVLGDLLRYRRRIGTGVDHAPSMGIARRHLKVALPNALVEGDVVLG